MTSVFSASGISAAAETDVPRILREKEVSSSLETDELKNISKDEASQLMSEEHKRLGHRPPSDSLASKAQSAGKSLQELGFTGNEPVTQAIASRIESYEHKALGYRPPPGSLAARAQSLADKNAIDGGNRTLAELGDIKLLLDDPQHVSKATAAHLQSAEHKTMGKVLPGSLAAQAQSLSDRHMNEPVTKELAARIESLEHKSLGHRPPPGSVSAQTQSLADKNDRDGGRRALSEIKDVKALLEALEEGATVSNETASRLHAAEHKTLGHQPPSGSLASQAQSLADRS